MRMAADHFLRDRLDTVRDKLMAAGLAPVGGTPEQFSRFIDSEINKWTKIAKDVGATAD